VSSAGPAIIPTLSGRDALFALLLLPTDRTTIIANRAATSTDAPSALNSLSPGSGPMPHRDGGVLGLLAGTSAGDDDWTAAADSIFAEESRE
jgi:hypothetical protein